MRPLILLLLISMLLACQAEHRPLEPIAITATTVLPKQYSASLKRIEPARRRVASTMLTIAKVQRPHADLRVGPGADYHLHDYSLPLGTEVLVLQSAGVWRKVLLTRHGLQGWVHAKAITQVDKIPGFRDLDMNSLPTVAALREIDMVRTFPYAKQAATKIPRGAMFRALSENTTGVLVWLAESNSVAWLDRKDVE